MDTEPSSISHCASGTCYARIPSSVAPGGNSGGEDGASEPAMRLVSTGSASADVSSRPDDRLHRPARRRSPPGRRRDLRGHLRAAGQATAIANTVAAARTGLRRRLRLRHARNTVTVTVTCGPGQPTRLFNDGKDHVTLSIASAPIHSPAQQVRHVPPLRPLPRTGPPRDVPDAEGPRLAHDRRRGGLGPLRRLGRRRSRVRPQR